MKKLIIEYLKNHKNVSFAELDRYLETKKMNHKGNSGIYYNLSNNIVAWGGMSEEYKNIILDLEKNNLINLRNCPVVFYLIDGGIPNIPTANSDRKYKKPHWLPCLLN